MRIILNIAEWLGIFMFMVGACGMDSENQLIPAAVLFAGAAIIWITMSIEEGRHGR